jgi:two-component system, cell cycle sensor histidine kinase and response regulator CckA
MAHFMATEQMLRLPGKTQTILLAETKSERWLSWIRLASAFAVVLLFLPGWINRSIESAIVAIQAASLSLLALYSTVYLVYTKSRRRIAKPIPYVLTLLDTLVITALLFSALVVPAPSWELVGIIFSAYFLSIAFTAFHHRASLSFFSGIIAVVCFSAIAYALFSVNPKSHLSIPGFCLRSVLIISAAALSAAVSRNNYRTVRKVLTSELRYDSLVDRLPEMIFSIDEQGNFIWTNKGCADLLGVPPDKLLGMNIKTFFTKPEQLKLEQGGVKATLEIQDLRGDRKYVDCTIQRVLRRTSQEAFDGLLADVTDRELAISQREEMIDRLFQYQKMESLGSLASGMAHDFNNILQTVIDATTIVEKETAEPETKKRMGLILETTTDARFLISELLALGRKKLMEYRHVDLGVFFNALVTQFSNQLGPNYHVRLEIPNEPLKVQGDPDYLKRVFQNLIGNACDAMVGGGNISIACSATKGLGGSGTIVVKVTDTGTGIAPDLTEKIFDPFFTTKKPGKGTGLGLALVRRIIVLHNGRVFVEHTGPTGTTFRIELPMISHEESEVDTKSIMMNRIGATILMLEDDPKIRNIMKIFLKEFEYSILEASSSDEAEKFLRANREKCRVLVMDWKIAGEDPHDVVMKLRAIREDLIVIVVSGYPPRTKSIETLHIFRWFTKPYDKNQLNIEIQRALRGMPARK